MELAPADVNLAFEVTYDSPSLFVGMQVFDTTGVSPVLVQGPDEMVNLDGTNTYFGKFVPTAEHIYVIHKAVYTDDDFETIDDNYSQASESIAAQTIGGGGSSSGGNNAVVGYVMDDDPIVGYVECE